MVFQALCERMIRRSVRRGASFLDRSYPGWDRQIDVSDFSIGTYDRCVLGQLYPGGYHEGVAVLSLARHEASKCGFDLRPTARWPNWRLVDSRSRFDYLDDCWKQVIQDRRQSA